MCQAYRRQYGCDFISAMPTNLYGPHDNYDLTSSHVAAALLVKAHQAKLERRSELEVWGTGTPRREFMYVDDLADALVFLLKNYSGDEHVNVGVGTDVTIRELAETVLRVVGHDAADPVRPFKARRHAAQAYGIRAVSPAWAGRRKPAWRMASDLRMPGTWRTSASSRRRPDARSRSQHGHERSFG